MNRTNNHISSHAMKSEVNREKSDWSTYQRTLYLREYVIISWALLHWKKNLYSFLCKTLEFIVKHEVYEQRASHFFAFAVWPKSQSWCEKRMLFNFYQFKTTMKPKTFSALGMVGETLNICEWTKFREILEISPLDCNADLSELCANFPTMFTIHPWN